MRCPRCRRETTDPAPPFCRECGAPLRLADDPAPHALDEPVAIGRRAGEGREREATNAGAAPAAVVASVPAPRPGGRRAELAEVERSQWDLALAAAAPGLAEPVPGAAAPVAAAPAPVAFGPIAPAAAAAGEPLARDDDGLPDVDVDAVEIHLRRPPSWRRAAAGALDALPFVAGGIALSRALVGEAVAGLPAPPTGIYGLLDLVARERVIVLSIAAAVALALGVYATLAHALAGATVGKRLLGLRVVGPDGARPSLGRSAARSALAAVSAALLGLGVLLALFTRSGRALHDLVARTWVVEAP